MIRRSLLILLTFISLSACSYPGNLSAFKDVKFSKPGITKQQLDADWSACRKENTVAQSFAGVSNEPKRRRSFAEEYLINDCGCEGLHCGLGVKNPKSPEQWRFQNTMVGQQKFVRAWLCSKRLPQTRPSFSDREYGRVQTSGLPMTDFPVGASCRSL